MSWILETEELELTITLGIGDIPADDALVSRLLRTAKTHNAIVPLMRYEVTRTSPTTYTYSWSTQDMRTFPQVLHLVNGSVLNQFLTSGVFAEEEFIPHRDTRVAVIDLLKTYDIVSIKIEWPM